MNIVWRRVFTSEYCTGSTGSYGATVFLGWVGGGGGGGGGGVGVHYSLVNNVCMVLYSLHVIQN